MPISHLLTDSFFAQNENSKQTFSSEVNSDHSHSSMKNGRRPSGTNSSRHVQFKQDHYDNHCNEARHSDNFYSNPNVHHHHEYDYDVGPKFNCNGAGEELDLEKYYDEDDSSDLVFKVPCEKNCNGFTVGDDNSSHRSRIANPVLIDTDGGIYDAWALALALRSADPESQSSRHLNIVGITTVNGCTSVDNATRNVCRLVKTLGKTIPPIPIFKGMESALTMAPGSSTRRPSFFGTDGYGDINERNLPTMHEVKIQSEHAVTGIIKMAEKYKGKLTILCLGPLTNLAMAVKLKPEIRHFVKEIFIVGGNSEGMGNMTVASEFNFFVDPEAANVVLESFNLSPVFVLPWETCMKSAALSQSFRTNTIANLDTPEVDLMNKLEENFLDKEDDQWIVPDAVLMACFLNREMIRKTEHYHCTVEVQGKHTRGMMVVDKNFIGQHPANVTLITEVSRKIFGKMIIWAVGELEVNDEDDNQFFSGRENIKMEPDYF